jgi:membrane protease YdiL (CAAX protease family)
VFLANQIAILVVLTVFVLGYLIFRGRQAGGGIEAALRYRESMSWSQIALYVGLLFLWAVIVFLVIGPPIEAVLRSGLLANLPAWFRDGGETFMTAPAAFPRTVVLITWVAATCTLILGAVIEEMYFRGHLLPLMASLGIWAPLLNTVLFGLYHFDLPWQIPTIILAIGPTVFVVWLRRNYRLALIVHLLINGVSAILLAVAVFA